MSLAHCIRDMAPLACPYFTVSRKVRKSALEKWLVGHTFAADQSVGR